MIEISLRHSIYLQGTYSQPITSLQHQGPQNEELKIVPVSKWTVRIVMLQRFRGREITGGQETVKEEVERPLECEGHVTYGYLKSVSSAN